MQHYHSGILRSMVRYWIASATWARVIASLPARSAIVRPSFRVRSQALAGRPNCWVPIPASSPFILFLESAAQEWKHGPVLISPEGFL